MFRRITVMVPLALLLVCACDKEWSDVRGDGDPKICFRQVIDPGDWPDTKAASLTAADTFRVRAFCSDPAYSFDDVFIQGTDTYDKAKGGPTSEYHYWPLQKDFKMTFCAVMPKDCAISQDTTIQYTVDSSAEDLKACKSKEYTSRDDNGVDLTLNHVLSKIQTVKIKSDTAVADFAYTVSELRFSGYNRGRYDFEKWATDSLSRGHVYYDSAPDTLKFKGGQSVPLSPDKLVLPQDSLKVSVRYSIIYKNELILREKLVESTFPVVMGKSYSLTLTLGTSKGYDVTAFIEDEGEWID